MSELPEKKVSQNVDKLDSLDTVLKYVISYVKGGIKMTMTGSTAMTSLATASPLAALSELDDPAVTSAPAGKSF